MTQVNNNAAAEAARKAAEEAARKAAEEAARKAQEAAAKKAQEAAAKKAQEQQQQEASKKAAEAQQTQQQSRVDDFKKDGTLPTIKTDQVNTQLQSQKLTDKLDTQKPALAADTTTPQSGLSTRRQEARAARRAARSELLRGTSTQANVDNTQTTPQSATLDPTTQTNTPGTQATQDTNSTSSLTDAPGTLATEARDDNNVNCIDRTHEMIEGMPEEERANSDVVFLRDKTNEDGNDAGHLMVRDGDGNLRDPNNPEAPARTMDELRAEGRYEPVMQDGEPVTMSAERFDTEMSKPPAERDLSGIPPEVANMRLADNSPIQADTTVLNGENPVTVDGLRGAIDALANEPGESGRIKFDAGVEGRLLGIFEAGGDLSLGVGVAKSDTGSISLSLNGEVAAKLGIDVGFAEIGARAGVQGQVTARFANSEDASKWLHQQFGKLNDTASDALGSPVLNMGNREDYSLSRPPTFVRKAGTNVGAYAEVDAIPGLSSIPGIPPGLSSEAALSVTRTGDQTAYFRRENGEFTRVGQGTESEVTYNAEATVAGQKVQVTYSQSTVQGDTNGDNNGEYDNLKISATLNPGANRDTIRTTVAAAMGMTAPPTPQDPNYAQYQEGVEAVTTALAGPTLPNGKLTVSYERNRVLENGEYNTQYHRWSLTSSVGTGKQELNVGAAEGEFQLQATKTEVISETIGTNTETYVRQLATDAQEGDWQRFAQENRAELEQMFPGQNIEELRTGWRQEAAEAATHQREVGRVVDDIIAAEPGFMRFSGGRRDAAGETLRDLPPERLAGVLDELARRGVSDHDIRRFTNMDGSENTEAFNALLQSAAPHRQYGDNSARQNGTRLVGDLQRAIDNNRSMGWGQVHHMFNQTRGEFLRPEQMPQIAQQLKDAGYSQAQLQRFTQTRDQRVNDFFTALIGQM
tara:strand:- start:18189 stop:20951 length:2763 start_codon:yes stop_codon:yes gene_type:complete